MENDPVSPITDGLFEALTLDPNLKKMAAKKVGRAYVKATLAAATVLPVSLTFGGALTISQIQARPPEIDPHVPSQTQNPTLLEMPRIIVTTTSARSFSASDYVIRTWDKGSK